MKLLKKIMLKVMIWIRIIIINVLVTLSLISLLFLAPPILFKFYNSFIVSVDNRSNLELYEKYYWAQTHFLELRQLETVYYDYITWRRNDFSGETVNIENGLRRTLGSTSQSSEKGKFWFFGGSSTWGTGVSDEYTYTSIFSNLNDVPTKNFGESGYIAHQSLTYLINILLIDGTNRDLDGINIIFYDGVNDVADRCRSEIKGLGSSQEMEIRQRLAGDGSYGGKWSFRRTFSQLIDLSQEIISRISVNSATIIENNFNCDNDPEKAYEVALSLVNTWKLTSDIVTGRGGNFTAILQPVAYIGTPEIDYLNLNSPNDNELAEQYAAVYPLIREIAGSSKLEFIDLSHAYDGCEDCYIDYCHTGPQANALLVDHLTSYLFK